MEQEQENIQDEDQALEGAQVLKRKEDLGRLKEDGVTLEKHLKDVTVNWSDIKARTVDHVDYAPSINVRVDEYNYTRDFGTFELEASKFQANFLGNVVDLGACCFNSLFCVFMSPHPSILQEINMMLRSSRSSGRTLPTARASSSPPTACSRSARLSRASFLLNLTVSTGRVTPCTWLASMAARLV